ncbi:M3 family metallopeptidase [Rhodoblastus sp.]|uniref:M3 family metallopeptidase n=1 Tax=Rhodoblastus sp. TaxID=1962975 RepID=UPI0035AD86C5
MNAQNPLLARWDAPSDLPPFASVKTEHYQPAFDVALREHDAEIAAIVDNPEPPTFENTIDALELAGQTLNRIGGVFWNLTGTDSTEELRAVERDLSPVLARHFAAISLNPGLFARVAALYEKRETLALTGEQARLLELTYKSFIRTGARLEGADRARYAEIAERLASLEMEFAQNVLADENDYLLELDEADLAGVPEDVKASAAQTARERNASLPYAMTLSRSVVEPFLGHAHRRDRREELFNAWIARGEHDGATDNRGLTAEILALRDERAKMLGYTTFAAYKLEPTMAGKPEAALDLLDKVWKPARAKAGEERQALQTVADAEGANFRIAAHDWRYYAEKLRLSAYAIDQSELSGYFQLEKMIEAAFYCAERLFGLQFAPRPDLPVYHPDVRVFEVLDRDGRHLAMFLGDYFARPGKRSGAWMSNFRGQKKLGGEVRPIIVNVMNFAKPAPDRPTLLSLTDVATLFHEFGHALHGMLSDVAYPSMSGTATPTDFVELPSQLYEHWALRPEVLEKFAIHHETGAAIPQDLIDRVIAARNFNQGFGTVEFCGSAFVDFLLHSRAAPPRDVVAAENGILRDIGMPSEIVARHRTPHFSHIFAGDSYAAGYYSYLWSEALDADGFAAFEETGDIFNPEVAQRLHDYVYSAGNQRDPNEAYALFRGRKPEFDALLRKKGLA